MRLNNGATRASHLRSQGLEEEFCRSRSLLPFPVLFPSRRRAVRSLCLLTGFSPFLFASRADEIARACAGWKAFHGYTVIGTSDAAALHYREIAYPSPTILLMGSERQGLLTEHQALCDRMVSIPMSGSCDSLNVAIATAVVLYEMLDQRTNQTKR